MKFWLNLDEIKTFLDIFRQILEKNGRKLDEIKIKLDKFR